MKYIRAQQYFTADKNAHVCLLNLSSNLTRAERERVGGGGGVREREREGGGGRESTHSLQST